MVNRTRCKWRATIDVKSVCRHSGSPRSCKQCFEFRVTSVQNNRGSGHRLNNGTGVIFEMIYFCRCHAIISKSSELSIFYIIKVSQPKVHQGSVTIKGAAGEFLRRGFEFYRPDDSFVQCI